MKKRTCEVCGLKKPVDELYPINLVRPNILKTIIEVKPDLEEDGLICLPDLRKIHSSYYESILKKEKGALSELEREVLDSISKHEIITDNLNEEFDDTLTFGQKLADKVARFGGSWSFIGLFALMMFSWMVANSLYILSNPFDPYPYILLNLVLSCLAAIQAPIIMMSQNRQSAKDRIKLDSEYMLNLKSELQIRQLNARLELLMKHQWQKNLEILRLLDGLNKDVRDL